MSVNIRYSSGTIFVKYLENNKINIPTAIIASRCLINLNKMYTLIHCVKI